jgi:hypothetical protein
MSHLNNTTKKPMSATKKQTAVQWLVEKLMKGDFVNNPDELIERANAMHEEQICTAYLAGDCQNMLPHEYFKETYD